MENDDSRLPTPILFVDDEAEARRAFARAMGARGFDVHLADSASEAIELAKRTPFSLIATDLNMPAMNGIELVDQLREIQADAIFMLVTGEAELCLPSSLHSDGIAGVVVKPWDADELAESIWRGIEMRRERESGWYDPVTTPGMREALGGVLLLEDDPKNGDLMLRSLAEGGLPEYQVIRARRLDEAVRAALDRPLQVIVTQLTLPDARGLDTILALNEAAPSTPIVAVSNTPDEALALRALSAGAQDYLVSGELTPAVLRRSVRFAMERKRAAQNPSVGQTLAPLEGDQFVGQVASALSRAKREGSRVAVAYLTLSRLKKPGSGETHELSGPLLARATERARSTLREYDTVVHLGDQRLGIILEGIEEGERVGGPAERLVRELEREFHVGKRALRLSATLGISVYPDDAETEEELCRCADMAGYRAQAHGPGSYEFFDEMRQRSWSSRSQLQSELLAAIEHLDFELDHELEHDFDSGRAATAQVLVTWRRADGKRWPLSRFSKLLEQQGWGPRLTQWMLLEACRRAVDWRSAQPGLSVRVTLSPGQLRDPALVTKVQNALEASGIPGAALEISVGEECLKERWVDAVLAELSALGARLSLENFRNESSVVRLSELPISSLRIGPALGDLAGGDDRSVARLRAAAGLSRALNLQLLAMGVDGPDQRDFLMGIGCERGQGNLYEARLPEGNHAN